MWRIILGWKLNSEKRIRLSCSETPLQQGLMSLTIARSTLRPQQRNRSETASMAESSRRAV